VKNFVIARKSEIDGKKEKESRRRHYKRD